MVSDELRLAEALITELIFSDSPHKPRQLRHIGQLLVSLPVIERIIKRFKSLRPSKRIFLNSVRMETNKSPFLRDHKELEHIWRDAYKGKIQPCASCSGRMHTHEEPNGLKCELIGDSYHFNNASLQTQLTIDLLHYSGEREWVQAVVISFTNSPCLAR
ncbi:hypothetical protein AAVH_20464 [Aphelenchoides avenae]|nr:hypothetical protein AAVH_20464 [Aphelenchus avenae]